MRRNEGGGRKEGREKDRDRREEKEGGHEKVSLFS